MQARLNSILGRDTHIKENYEEKQVKNYHRNQMVTLMERVRVCEPQGCTGASHWWCINLGSGVLVFVVL
jgi:hypothetical protein